MKCAIVAFCLVIAVKFSHDSYCNVLNGSQMVRMHEGKCAFTLGGEHTQN